MVTVTVPAAAVARLEQLDAAQAALQQERVGLRKMRQELEKAAQQLELQRAAWERDRVSLADMLCLCAGL
jgi:FtsZ-binding cell division protein ZapB